MLVNTPAWKALAAHAEQIKQTHLRSLVQDTRRYASMTLEHDGVFIDISRQRVTEQTLGLLYDLAAAADIGSRIRAMRDGVHINKTEDRAVAHIALRAAPDEVYTVDSKNVVPEVHAVLEKIRRFSEEVRSGARRGVTGQLLTDVIAIGIGGSYLGAKCVYEALKFDPEAAPEAKGRRLHFLANVDPVNVARAVDGLNPETTLVVVISKTFTTAETMMNAKTIRQWLIDGLKHKESDWKKIVSKHMVAVSTNLKLVEAFGIDPENAFGFWDWVGGRFSVTSAVGILPLALQYGFKAMERFLAGARSIDHNFLNAPPRKNLALLLGLIGVWNSTFLGYQCRAIACYSEALMDFAQHIQQVDMESNGKAVTIDGQPLPYEAGEIVFGERGTNSQHSFFQLFHQGRPVPVDFVGMCVSQTPYAVEGELPNHDELMSNFFAQPDALACGKTAAELKAEGVDEKLIPHKVMPGNRPSTVILLPKLGAYEMGQLLALFEHRTAVQGFLWNINSFDQFGVELGKVLATQVKKQIAQARKSGDPAKAEISASFNPSTRALIQRYLAISSAAAAFAGSSAKSKL